MRRKCIKREYSILLHRLTFDIKTCQQELNCMIGTEYSPHRFQKHGRQKDS